MVLHFLFSFLIGMDTKRMKSRKKKIEFASGIENTSNTP